MEICPAERMHRGEITYQQTSTKYHSITFVTEYKSENMHIFSYIVMPYVEINLYTCISGRNQNK